jgi:hypothetical protein
MNNMKQAKLCKKCHKRKITYPGKKLCSRCYLNTYYHQHPEKWRQYNLRWALKKIKKENLEKKLTK